MGKDILGVARPHPVVIVVNLIEVQVCQIVAGCPLQVGIAPEVGQGEVPAVARIKSHEKFCDQADIPQRFSHIWPSLVKVTKRKF